MVLVLTPLSFELDALRAHFPAREGVTLAVGGHGKVQFALTAQHLIRELKPRLVVCAGAAGSLRAGVNALDVVAGIDTVEHDFNLRFVRRPLPRFAGDESSLARLRALGTPDFGLHFGTIASGDEDVVDAVRAGAVRELTDGLAVAWEGAGGARAAAYCGVPYLELRVITDFADAAAPADFKKHLRAGMKNVAFLLSGLSGD